VSRQELQTFILSLKPEDLVSEYALIGRGNVRGREVLFSTLRHLAEHLGHMEIIRDWLSAGNVF